MKNKGLMISCKRATELIEISQEQKLAFKERMRLKLHNFLCKVCDIYAQQSKKLSMILNRHAQSKSSNATIEDLSKLKNKILSNLVEKGE